MQHSNGVYTQRFNTIHGYDGHLFRGRYTSILIDADRYLLKVMRYIHRNPIKDHYFTKKTHSEVPESRLLAPGKDTIISVVCAEYNVSLSELQISKRGHVNEPRNSAMYLMRYLKGDTLSALCKEFRLGILTDFQM